jgi:hypothetical protein
VNSKKWIKILLTLCTLAVGFVGGVNYLVDPFDIFHTKILKEQFQINERFIKIEFLEKNHNKFDSYMFGSCRIGTTPPDVLNQYVNDANFYNFTISSANLYDYLLHLQYFIKKEYPLKNLYLEIDIDNMNNYGRIESDYLRKFHPYVLDQSLYSYYISYLTGFFPFNIRGKIELNIKRDDITTYSLETGSWSKPIKEKKIQENPLKFISEESSFHIKNARLIKNSSKLKNLKALSEIVNLSKKNNINLIVFTTPYNKNMMDNFILNDYFDFLKEISTVINFYDFTGYNSITLNNTNYYEPSHYRENVGRLIAAKIFNDKSIDVPKDFGVLVTKDNINEHLENLRKQVNDYELEKNVK